MPTLPEQSSLEAVKAQVDNLLQAARPTKRDSITELFRGMAPDGDDTMDILLASGAMGGGQQSFGQAYSALRAQKLKRAEAIAGLMLQQEGMDIKRGELAQRRSEYLLKEDRETRDLKRKIAKDEADQEKARQRLELDKSKYGLDVAKAVETGRHARETEAISRGRLNLDDQKLQAGYVKEVTEPYRKLVDAATFAKYYGQLDKRIAEGKLTEYRDIVNAGSQVAAEMKLPAAAKIQADRYRYLGPYVDNTTGEYRGEGVFDKATATMKFKATGGELLVDMPPGLRPSTETNLAKNQMGPGEFAKLVGQLRESEQSLAMLQDYWKTVRDAPTGWKLLAEQFIGQMNTVFGNKLDSQEQFNTLMQTGHLQGLLGRYRTEIVGGGVMTEQDAMRVIQRLGGDVSALRNPEVVSELIKSLMEHKIKTYNEVELPLYNVQVGSYPRGTFQPKKPIVLEEGIFQQRGSSVQEDLEFTAKKHGISVDEVKRRLGIR